MSVNYVAKRLIYAVIMLSSFGHCVAGSKALSRVQARVAAQPVKLVAQNLAQKKSCPAIGANLGTDMSEYNKLSRPDRIFYDWANKFWGYDALIKAANNELQKLQDCLHTGDCKLVGESLNGEIKLLEEKIAELTKNKNRIVTIPEAFKRSLPVIGGMALLVGGAYFANNLSNEAEMEKLIVQSKSASLTAEEQERLWQLFDKNEALVFKVAGILRKHDMSEVYVGHGHTLRSNGGRAFSSWRSLSPEQQQQEVQRRQKEKQLREQQWEQEVKERQLREEAYLKELELEKQQQKAQWEERNHKEAVVKAKRRINDLPGIMKEVNESIEKIIGHLKSVEELHDKLDFNNLNSDNVQEILDRYISEIEKNEEKLRELSSKIKKNLSSEDAAEKPDPSSEDVIEYKRIESRLNEIGSKRGDREILYYLSQLRDYLKKRDNYIKEMNGLMNQLNG